MDRVELNRFYNDFIYAQEEDEAWDDHYGLGKRAPYIGWFWRNVDFFSGDIPIGDCGEFKGFMQNNKLDHPERRLTDAEVTDVMCIIDAAVDGSGNLEDLWEYFQSLEIPRDGE